MDLQDYITRTSGLDDPKALIEAFKAFVAGFGIDVASYHIITEAFRPVGFEDGLVFQSFPDDWVEHYIREGYFAFDPIITAAKMESAPFKWFDVGDMFPLGAAQKRYLETLKASTVKDGLAVPIYGARGTNAYFGLGSRAGPLADMRVLQFAAHQLHDRFLAVHGPILEAPPPALTAREKDVLHWMVLGKSNADIADILGVSPHTVDTLVRRLFAKLGVTNRISAALRAVGAGLIAA